MRKQAFCLVSLLLLCPAFAQEPCPTPTPTPTPEPVYPSTSPYNFTTWLDLVPAEPRVFYPGVSNAIPAYVGYPGSTWSDGGCVNISLTGCSASSTTTQVFLFSLSELSEVYRVDWHLIWYPRSTQAGVRLVLMDAGFANPIVIGTTEPDTPQATIAYTVYRDVTAAWNTQSIIARGIPHPEPGSYKYLGMQVRGNGSLGPVIYLSRLTFTHRIP